MRPLYGLDVPRADATAGIVRSVMEDDLSHLKQMETLAVSPEASAQQVAAWMKEAQTGCALVLDDRKKLVGIFTEHDVLCKLMKTGDDAQNVPVSELMTRNPEALKDSDSVAAALNKMAMGRFRHIPIARSDGSYSVASIKSVLNYIAQEDW
jgi:signal-transduction protein with cAMP-binding, CBS, and nucleotidyltransferase domain